MVFTTTITVDFSPYIDGTLVSDVEATVVSDDPIVTYSTLPLSVTTSAMEVWKGIAQIGPGPYNPEEPFPANSFLGFSFLTHWSQLAGWTLTVRFVSHECKKTGDYADPDPDFGESISSPSPFTAAGSRELLSSGSIVTYSFVVGAFCGLFGTPLFVLGDDCTGFSGGGISTVPDLGLGIAVDEDGNTVSTILQAGSVVASASSPTFVPFSGPYMSAGAPLENPGHSGISWMEVVIIRPETTPVEVLLKRPQSRQVNLVA